MAFFSPPPKGKKVAPLPQVREETPMYYVSPTSSGGFPYANRNMYRHAFPVNDPKNAAAEARRAATLASMANPNIPVHRPGAALGGAGAGAGARNNNAPAPRPKLIIPNTRSPAARLDYLHNNSNLNEGRGGANMGRLEENRGVSSAFDAAAAASNEFVNVNLSRGHGSRGRRNSRRRNSRRGSRHTTRRR
jgi:hypothetical protein